VRGSQLGRLSSVAAQPPAPAEAASGAPRVPDADADTWASSSHVGEVQPPRFGHDDDVSIIGSPDEVLTGVGAESRVRGAPALAEGARGGGDAPLGRGGGGGGAAGPSAWALMSALPPSRDGGAAPAPVTAPAPTGLLAQAAALVERGLLADADSDALYRRLDASDPRVLAAHAAARCRAVATPGSAAEAAALAEVRALLAAEAPLPPQEEAAEAVEIPQLPRGQVRALLAALRRPLPHPRQSRCMLQRLKEASCFTLDGSWRPAALGAGAGGALQLGRPALRRPRRTRALRRTRAAHHSARPRRRVASLRCNGARCPRLCRRRLASCGACH